jgi:hypothetical protein
MSQALDHLLGLIRQHPGFQELLAAVSAPEPARYSPHDEQPPDVIGARVIYASGRQRQHQAWLAFLTGEKASQHKE